MPKETSYQAHKLPYNYHKQSFNHIYKRGWEVILRTDLYIIIYILMDIHHYQQHPTSSSCEIYNVKISFPQKHDITEGWFEIMNKDKP